jgi:hypothetical protein
VGNRFHLCPRRSTNVYIAIINNSVVVHCVVVHCGVVDGCIVDGRIVNIIDRRIIIDDGCFLDNGDVLGLIYIKIVYMGAGDILGRNETPYVWGRVVSSNGHADAYRRRQRSPAIITLVTSPGYPGRSPLISRHPAPSIIIVKEPTTIVEWSPAPGIIGHPGPTFIGIYPMTS